VWDPDFVPWDDRKADEARPVTTLDRQGGSFGSRIATKKREQAGVAPRTQLCDRRNDETSLDEYERIWI